MSRRKTGPPGRWALETWSQPRAPGRYESGNAQPVPADAPHSWRRMDDSSHRDVNRIWQPRATAADAAAKCFEWTGGIGIPELQVRHLDTGEVAWRWRWDGTTDPSPDPVLLPDWWLPIERQLRAKWAAEHAAARAAELADQRRRYRLRGQLPQWWIDRYPDEAAEIIATAGAEPADPDKLFTAAVDRLATPPPARPAPARPARELAEQPTLF